MKLGACFLVLSALLALAAAGTVPLDEEISRAPAPVQPGESARSRFTLPKIFDFSRFKQLYRKSYNSIAEELARQKLFFGHLFRAIISMIKYKRRASDYFLSINEMSDKTPEEINRTKLPASAFSDEIANTAEVVDNRQADDEDNQVPAASGSDIERALEEIEQRKDEPGYKEIAEEFDRARGNSRRRRETSNGSLRSSLTFDYLLDESPMMVEEPVDVLSKVQTPKSNNPAYEPPELESCADASGGEQQSNQQQPPMPINVAEMINNVQNGFKFVSGIVQGAGQILAQMSGQKEQKELRVITNSAHVPEHKQIDWRESNCFFMPRSQGECGSCYAFAAISLFEFLYCKATGKLVPFSEQYIVDCGDRIEGLHGCEGGKLTVVTRFIEDYGLELRRNYPYRRRHDQCPYDAHQPAETMGYLKLPHVKRVALKRETLDKYLQVTPILVALSLSPHFREYGGGVDDNEGCNPNDNHAMLIIGSGTEDGKDYWLLRNSHSVSWGEQGYYKISTEGFDKCLSTTFGGVVSTLAWNLDKFTNSDNPKYQSSVVQQRYDQYLLGIDAANNVKL